MHADSTRQPVRWTRIDRRSATKIFHQARALDRRSHVAGKHGGRIGHTGILVLECLIFDHLNWRTGQLDPSYEAIAAKANLARSTVGAALRRLKELGILNWLRRCEETMEGGRYVLRQISNAYAVLPPSLWRAVGLLPAKAPPPAPGAWGVHHHCRTSSARRPRRRRAAPVRATCCCCWISIARTAWRQLC